MSLIKLSPNAFIDCWYDRSLRLWTGLIKDAEGNQIHDAIYATKKEDCIAITAYTWGMTLKGDA